MEGHGDFGYLSAWKASSLVGPANVTLCETLICIDSRDGDRDKIQNAGRSLDFSSSFFLREFGYGIL
jgi:hypothetical protein